MTSSVSSFFEGTEKLLEVWFRSSVDNTSVDLRNVSRVEWEHLLKKVKCEIISFTRDNDMDSFVLSESSMFVTKERFILKTCGTTTLLLAVEPLLALVQKYGFDQVLDVFYSRKNFMKPENQHDVHKKFEYEAEHLDQVFKDHNGAAYALGRINRDCWYLYTLDTNAPVQKPDQTIELLMWDMCDQKMKIFTQEVCETGREATRKSGICDIVPGAKIDDFMFEPCGYSMNGIITGGYYITIHVTPEPHCSYVSFESNIPQESYDSLIEKVLDIFNPGKFLITIFANQESVARDTHKGMEKLEKLKGYCRSDHQVCMFKSYNLTYSHFCRPVI